ncbi:MAG: hypothetical protein RL490_2123 [Pseudomonadota bacterium]|jgi:UDP-MurNAc hydroxylase
MDVTILSHACLLVRSGDTRIIVDPWLLGSCYWRSWWNFPQAVFDPDELGKVDAVIISHVHWDHWHGPTLKKFFKDTPIIVPDEPGQRSRRDLAALRLGPVRAARHGETIHIGPIAITLYQFGLFLNDAALVIEADGHALLDANDAKLAGGVLQRIVDRHGPFSLAFRSHSSANPRIRFQTLDNPAAVHDDRDHYFRAFTLFMDAVQPRHAVPFASNHCHLHDDVFALNSYVSNPVELAAYVAAQPEPHGWDLAVMLPGARWSSETGFHMAPLTPFDDLPASLAAYRQQVAPTLDRYRETEMAVTISDATWRRLLKMVTAAPRLLRPAGPVCIEAIWPDGRSARAVLDARAGTLDLASALEPGRDVPVLRFPAIVLRDAILKNMFHHAGISKRCAFIAADATAMRRLQRVFKLLELVEHEVLPLNSAYFGRMARAYLARWRELIVYGRAAWLAKVRRLPMYLVEERILGGAAPVTQGTITRKI